MNIKLFNYMIEYIEKNLEEPINYNDLAKILGVSEYSLQRIFVFLTGISISEYIRKRRLSKSYEELKSSDIKIIDLAVKYNYDSSISFSRAFKNYFGITPSQCRKSNKKYKLFPIISLNDMDIKNSDVSYEIKHISKKSIYCFEVSAAEHDDLLFKIRKLYKKINDENIIDNNDKYGISLCEKDKYIYYVGSSKYIKNTKRIIINDGTYAIFNVGSNLQKEISKVYNFIYNVWEKSTNYKILDMPQVEFYKNNICYIFIPIEDKQN